MKTDLTKRLGNYEKRPEKEYQTYALGLRVLVDELSRVHVGNLLLNGHCI